MSHNNELPSILLGKLIGCMILAFMLYLQHDVRRKNEVGKGRSSLPLHQTDLYLQPNS